MVEGGDEKERGLDWSATWRRLERLDAATEASASQEEEAAVLEARARALARPPPREDAAGTLLEFVHFRSGEQEYALGARFALEVLRAPELTPLPGAPPLLRGLTLLRGEVLPVVELAPLFGRPAPTFHGPVLVVGATRPEFGVRADAVEEVRLLARAALLPPPPTLGPEARVLVSGISREGVIVLEGAALLRDGRLFFDFSEERIT
jgi:purine-binding chemotaxis protein CheW